VTVRSLAVLAAAIALVAGCPMPASFTTPRTIPQGKVAHAIGVEWVALDAMDERTDRNYDGDTRDQGEVRNAHSVFPFAFPAYVYRLGLSDSMDVGVKGSALPAAVVDLKVQLLRSDLVDVAMDPSVEVTLAEYLSLPVIVGLNLDPRFIVFAGPRFTYGFLLRPTDGRGPSDLGPGGTSPASTVTGGLVGGGAGFRLALGGVCVVPEIHWQRGVFGNRGVEVTNAAIGLVFGDGQPDCGGGT